MDGVSIKMTGDEQQASKAFERLQKKNEALTKSLKESKAQAKSAEAELLKMGGTAPKIDVLNKKTAELGRSLKDAGRAGESAGKQIASNFGASVVAGVGSAVSGVLVLTKMVTGTVDAMRDAVRVADEAAARVKAGAPSQRELAQISRTPADYVRIRDMSRAVRVQEGIPAEEANRIAFAAESTGQMKDVNFFASLKRIGLGPEEAMGAVQKMQANFGGRKGAGTAQQLVNELLAAAGPTPANAGSIASVASTAAKSMRAIGATDEELLALVGQFSIAGKSPDIAADEVNSLASQLFKKRDRINFGAGGEKSGLALMMALPQLAAEGRLMSENGKESLSMTDFLGEMRAASAADFINKNSMAVRRLHRDVKHASDATGTGGDLARKALSITEGDMMLKAELGARAAEQNKLLVSEKAHGSAALVAQAIIDKHEAALIKAGDGRISRYFGMSAIRDRRMLLGDELFIHSSFNDLYASYFEGKSGPGQREMLERFPALADDMRTRNQFIPGTGGGNQNYNAFRAMLRESPSPTGRAAAQPNMDMNSLVKPFTQVGQQMMNAARIIGRPFRQTLGRPDQETPTGLRTP